MSDSSEPSWKSGAVSSTFSRKSGVRSALDPKRPRKAWLWISLLVVLAFASWLPLLRDPERSSVFQTTLSIAGGTLWRSLLGGAILAWAAFRTRAYGRWFWWTMLAVWGALPLSVTTIAWKSVWQRPDSWWNQIRQALRGGLASTESPDSLVMPMSRWGGEAAVIWIHTSSALPWVALLLGLAASLRDRQQEEAAEIDRLPWAPGVWRRWSAFGLVAAIGIFLVALGEMAASDVFAVRTYAEEVYLGEPAAAFDPFGAAAQHVGFPLLQHICAVGALATLSALAIGWATAMCCRLEFVPAPLDSRKPSRLLATLVLFTTVSLFLVIPIAHLIGQAGVTITPDPEGGRPFRSWHAWTVIERILEQPWRLRDELAVSLVLASSVAIASLSAAQATLAMVRRYRWLLPPVLIVTAIALAIPGPLLGVLALKFRTAGGSWAQVLADQSLLFPLLASTLKAYPLALVIGVLISSRVPEMLRQWNRLESIPWWQRWWRLEIEPFLGWHLLTGTAILLGVLGDVSTTSLILPPGVDTVSRRLLGMVHAGVDDAVAAATLGFVLILGITATLVVCLAPRTMTTEDF